jgi:hypothetical protein
MQRNPDDGSGHKRRSDERARLAPRNAETDAIWRMYQTLIHIALSSLITVIRRDTFNYTAAGKLARCQAMHIEFTGTRLLCIKKLSVKYSPFRAQQ